jgi:hypothetical protein
MKAVKFFALFIFASSFSSLIAQTLEMDWGQAVDLEKNHFYQKIIGSDKEGFFTIKSEGILGVNDETITLEYYSATMNARESANDLIMPTVAGAPTHFEAMFYLNSKLILFTSGKGGNGKALYVQYLNSDGSLKNKPKEIGSISSGNSEKDGFNFVEREDGKIMIYYHNTFASYNGEPFTFKVMNSDLIEEVNVSLELPLKEISFDVIQSEMGKNNDIYMLVKAEKPKDKKKASAAAEYDYKVLVYTLKKKEFHPFPVSADKYVPAHTIMGVDLNGNIVVGGFFANKTVKIAGEFMGAFYNRINPNTLKADLIDPKKNVKIFTKEIMAEFSQVRNGETPDKYFSYVMKDLVFFMNGGFAFVGEQQYKTSTTIIAPGTKEETKIDYYFYNDLLICGVNKDGVMDWQVRIAKNQNSSDDKGYFHSVATFVDANKLKIIYNDNRANLNNKIAEKTKELKNNPVLVPKGQAILATLYSDGSYEKYPMFKDDAVKMVIVPRMISKMGKRFLTYAQDGKSIKFGSFVFE